MPFSRRIEGQCKHLGAGILVSGDVRAFLPVEDFMIGSAVEVSLAGKDHPVPVHPVES